ncbi:MAG: phosphoglycolate phosphatase [Pseudomonadota bacterium]
MEHDFCNADGARRLKQRIEDYWRERGYSVDIKLIEAGFVPAMRSARMDVRSDMVNGLPARKNGDERTSERSNDRGNPKTRGLLETV